MENQNSQNVKEENENGIIIKSKIDEGYITFAKKPLIVNNFPHDLAISFLELGEEERYGPDDEIINVLQVGRDFYLVCEGIISVWREGIRLATLTKGDVFGELVIFRNHYRIASVKSEAPTTVLKFNRHILMDFFNRQTNNLFLIYCMNIIEIMRRKLILTNERVCELEMKLLNQ